MSVNSNPKYKQLVKAFSAPRSVLLRTSSCNLFRDWLEIVWAFLNVHHSPETFKELADRFDMEGGKLLGQYLSTYLELVEEYPFSDILGHLYMEIGDAVKHAGQFFTPEPICRMMASMMMGDEDSIRSHVADKGYVSVMDPCVGSGAMLLAAATHVHSIDPMLLTKCRFYGGDVDQTCVTMCRIQLRMNGMDQMGRLMRLSMAIGSKMVEPPKPIVEPPPVINHEGKQLLLF